MGVSICYFYFRFVLVSREKPAEELLPFELAQGEGPFYDEIF